MPWAAFFANSPWNRSAVVPRCATRQYGGYCCKWSHSPLVSKQLLAWWCCSTVSSHSLLPSFSKYHCGLLFHAIIREHARFQSVARLCLLGAGATTRGRGRGAKLQNWQHMNTIYLEVCASNVIPSPWCIIPMSLYVCACAKPFFCVPNT